MPKRVLILGAGISGLSLAYYLQKRGDCEITIFEGSDRVGGWLRSDLVDGFLFERGPRSLRGSAVLELAQELKLPMIQACAKRRYLYRDGQLKAVRPTLPLLLGFLRYKMSARPQEDVSVYSFFEKRLGKRLTNRYIDALVKGIYAGDMHTLSMEACFPNVWKQKKVKKTGLFSFPDGVETLPRELARRLDGQIVLERHVKMDEVFDADVVYSTLPSPHIPRKTIHVVNLGYHEDVLKQRGFGYLIPSSEKENILGVVWDSQVFPQQMGKTRMTVMTESDDLKDVERHLGMGEPDVISMSTATIPQYQVGHREHVEEIALAHPHMRLLGSSYYGVSVNDCIVNARLLA